MILLFCNEKAQSFIFWNCAIQILAHIKVFYVYLNSTELYIAFRRGVLAPTKAFVNGIKIL